MRQVENSVSDQERRELQREQERLLLKMEKKGEQIGKLYKHKAQVSTQTKSSLHTQFNSKFVSFYSSLFPFHASPLDKEVKKGSQV